MKIVHLTPKVPTMTAGNLLMDVIALHALASGSVAAKAEALDQLAKRAREIIKGSCEGNA